jgi:hypothetical protein
VELLRCGHTIASDVKYPGLLSRHGHHHSTTLLLPLTAEKRGTKACTLVSICDTKNAKLKKNEESLILSGNVIDNTVSFTILNIIN